jgi:hypothetical protein
MTRAKACLAAILTFFGSAAAGSAPTTLGYSGDGDAPPDYVPDVPVYETPGDSEPEQVAEPEPEPEPAAQELPDCGDREAGLLAEAPKGPRLKPAAVTASSSNPNWKSYTFKPLNVADGSPAISWQPKGGEGGGLGEWIELKLDRPRTVAALGIANGMQLKDKLGDLYALNNRARRLCLRLVGPKASVEVAIELPDGNRGYDYVSLDELEVTSVRLRVDAVHKGDQWNDLAIGELVLFAPEAPKGAKAPAGGGEKVAPGAVK